MQRPHVILKSQGTTLLNERQARFVGFYVDGCSATEAARRAGYGPSSKYIDRIAVRLMRTDKIANAIVNRQAEQRQKASMQLEEAVATLTNQIRANIKDFVDPETGKLSPIEQLPRHLAACIEEIDVSRDGRIVRYRLHNGQKALYLLGRMLGWVQAPNVTVNQAHIELSDEQRTRIWDLVRAIEQQRNEQRALPGLGENGKQ
jgi:hypothetical protein